PAQFFDLLGDPGLKATVQFRLFIRALVQLAEQPRVRHRNHRLSSEVFEERDLFVGKQPNLLAAGDDQSEEAVVFAQRHIQRCAYAGVKRGTSDRIGGLSYIRHLHNASAAQQLPDRMRWPGWNPSRSPSAKPGARPRVATARFVSPS